MIQRLTMTFDPGRIKRGLDVEREDGTTDCGGRSATRWSIDRDWPDAHGVPLVDGYSARRFAAGRPFASRPTQHSGR